MTFLSESIMTSSSPRITIGETDFTRLTNLAEATAHSNSAVSDFLMSELDRATVKPDHLVKPTTVKMGSTLTYETDHGEHRTVTLVFPVDADISRGKISILTPIGAALIGLHAGQSINWTAPNGEKHKLTIITASAEQEALDQAAQ
jgi:regulator of nucleoside diphosphate kinase